MQHLFGYRSSHKVNKTTMASTTTAATTSASGGAGGGAGAGGVTTTPETAPAAATATTGGSVCAHCGGSGKAGGSSSKAAGKDASGKPIVKIDVHTHILPKTWPSLKERYGYGGFIRLEHHCAGRYGRKQ